eukprot:m.19224 g.19224  ORF g.19224 m.19224 type:complete len:770 (-) comp12384_c0_seq1:35-2344(-)
MIMVAIRSRTSVLTSVIVALISSSCAASVDSRSPSYSSNDTLVKPFQLLAPLLIAKDGTPVTSSQQWVASRRTEVADLVSDTLMGRWPTTSERPTFSSKLTTRINSTVFDSGATSSFYNLTFVNPSVSFVIEMLAPKAQQGESFPLFLTQWNHHEWAVLGLSRGYVSIIYPGADTRDEAPAMQQLFPKATMMLIKARAFVASLTLDFALNKDGGVAGLPNINPSQVCITGHSRNGKQSLIAAAFEQRFTAVVGSSPGAPIASPYSFSSHNYYGEGPDAGVAGLWWLNSTINYAAHPETLPMDGHGVLALIAPRHCATADAWTDHEGDDTFANENNIATAAAVYELFGAEDRLQIMHRPGDHHGFISVNTYFDYFDFAFNRTEAVEFAASPDSAVFGKMRYMTAAGFNWDIWAKLYAATTPPAPGSTAPLTDRVKWLLQSDEPTVSGRGSTKAEDGPDRFHFVSVMMGIDAESDSLTVQRQPVAFGQYVTGSVYWPTNHTKGASLPVLVWLHPYSYSTGFSTAYGGANVYEDLANAGFVVLAYDQVGFGTRLREGGPNFYRRRGAKSSLFGHAVGDAHAAIDFVTCLSAERRHSKECTTGEHFGGSYPNLLPRIPDIDSSKVFLAGYSLGGNVALHAAATDPRVTAVASFSGFTPMRTDTNDRATAGIRRLYDVHALLPRLGLFASDPASIPYDYDELIAALAPRPTLIYTVTDDRDATLDDVKTCVGVARKAWGSNSDKLTLTITKGYTDMGSNQSLALVAWARTAAGK